MNNEEIHKILAEIRTVARSQELFDGEEVGDALIRGSKILEWADRIERAANNLESSFGMALSIEDGLRKRDAERAPGNAAAMRAVLIFADSIDVSPEVLEETEDWEADVVSFVDDLQERAKAALAAPARNCDRYGTAKDALDAFIREKEIKAADVDNMNLRDFFDWLFAPANGGAKCVNGLRGEPDCRGCNEHCEDVRKRNCFYWNPDIEGGVCSLTGKKSCPISCDNFHVPEKVSPPPAEGGKE